MMGFVQISVPISLTWVSVVTTLMTPSGTPACIANSQRAKAEKGVSAPGLMTTVQPAARAAPTLRVIIAFGKSI